MTPGLRAGAAAAAALGLVLALGACGSTDGPLGGGQPDASIGAPASTVAPPGGGGGGGGGGGTTTLPEDEGDIEVSTELPDGWPDDLPVPDDAALEFSQRTEQEDGSLLLTADFSVEDGGANVYTAFLDDLEDGGATILQRSSGETQRGYAGSITFETEEYTGNLSVEERGGTTVLTVSVLPG